MARCLPHILPTDRKKQLSVTDAFSGLFGSFGESMHKYNIVDVPAFFFINNGEIVESNYRRTNWGLLGEKDKGIIDLGVGKGIL